MPEKVKVTEQQALINKFAFCLLKHFKDSKIKVQDSVIKIPVDQMCGQDFYFLTELNNSTGNQIGLNVSRSGKGLVILLGVDRINCIPKYLINYKRSDGYFITEADKLSVLINEISNIAQSGDANAKLTLQSISNRIRNYKNNI